MPLDDRNGDGESLTGEERTDARLRPPAGRDVVYAWVRRTQEVMVFRYQGTLVACSATCPHMGARLGVDHRLGAVVCPWHGLAFDLPACRSNHPRYRRLRVYAVTEHDGHVQVD